MNDDMIKIMYVGLALSGRRTSLAAVQVASGRSGNPLHVEADETCWVDWRHGDRLFVLELRVSIHRDSYYYTDQVHGIEKPGIRREIDELCRADGLVFVVDSQLARASGCKESLAKLHQDFASRGRDAAAIPTVFQINKRDLRSVLTVEWVRDNFRAEKAAYVESVATEREGTSEAIDALLSLLLEA